jgi:hypothetical protein
VEGPTTRFSDLDVGAQLAPFTAAQGQSLHSAPPDGAGRGSDDPVDTGSNLFQAQLDPKTRSAMPPHAVVALDALERNSNAHGDCMRGQRGLANSVPSPTLLGSRGQRSSTGHASVGTINAGLKWLEEHAVITSWIPRAAKYGVKMYRFANHLVRKNLARLKRIRLNQQAWLRRTPMALARRNLNGKKQSFRSEVGDLSSVVSRWAAEAPEGFYYVPGLHIYAPVDVQNENPPDQSPLRHLARRPRGALLWLRNLASRARTGLLALFRVSRAESEQVPDEW